MKIIGTYMGPKSPIWKCYGQDEVARIPFGYIDALAERKL